MVFDAQDAGAGGEGVVGEVHVDLGLPRPQPVARSRVGVGVVPDLREPGIQRARRACGIERLTRRRGSSRRPGSNGSTASLNGVSRGSGCSVSLGCGASRSASSSRPGSTQSLSRSSYARVDIAVGAGTAAAVTRCRAEAGRRSGGRRLLPCRRVAPTPRWRQESRRWLGSVPAGIAASCSCDGIIGASRQWLRWSVAVAIGGVSAAGAAAGWRAVPVVRVGFWNSGLGGGVLRCSGGRR